MSKQITIILEDIKEGQITIRDESPLRDWSKPVIVIPYEIMQDTGRRFDKGHATFYAEMPVGEDNENWFQIPANIASNLQGAILMALDAIRTRLELI